jgi:hypothetical protein
MYGTVARYKLKPGMEGQLLAFERDIREAQLPGLFGEFTFRMDEDPNTYYEAVVFESREAYRAVAESPEQGARYRKLLALLDGPPESLSLGQSFLPGSPRSRAWPGDRSDASSSSRRCGFSSNIFFSSGSPLATDQPDARSAGYRAARSALASA